MPHRNAAIPERILLGPGPSLADPRVLRAMNNPMVGYLDPAYLAIMDEVAEHLRTVFQTRNRATFPVQGTGFSGMDSCFGTLLEPGDKVIIAVNGFFGSQMCEMAGRYGAKVVRLDQEWGKAFQPEVIGEALRKNRDAKFLAIVHAETSAGVLQPLEEISHLCRENGVLLLVDAVTSLGGVELAVDDWGIDICYSGSQKCLGAPPGMAPVTLSDRALGVIAERKTRPASYYLDLSLIKEYWGESHTYHHTGPMAMVYAMREALRIVTEEGLQARWVRHRLNSAALCAGLEALGFELHADPVHRLPTLTTVRIPQGMDDAKTRSRLLNEFNIEIGGGLGHLKGKMWRIGLMGYASNRRNVLYLLSALEAVCAEAGRRPSRPGAGVTAAQVFYLNPDGK
ncbi:MAG: alanine--glyoxylate aminotransferase family protein [Candidatus Tectomicrobia bacterium]|nr:alanine--glyoxylate aminotransferase family protein [Candidatus Tectomicrobia bacterium]